MRLNLCAISNVAFPPVAEIAGASARVVNRKSIRSRLCFPRACRPVFFVNLRHLAPCVRVRSNVVCVLSGFSFRVL